jgi:hypothetical protein
VNINEEEEVNELKATGVYVAGVTTNCRDREDLYDIYLDGESSQFFENNRVFSWKQEYKYCIPCER